MNQKLTQHIIFKHYRIDIVGNDSYLIMLVKGGSYGSKRKEFATDSRHDHNG
ncbi:hypothetical protein KTJ32_14360 [Acinetobacter gyllenbergii]|uniref:hypothetical protein n=1 Tax=Acinetobacter gyllenbergii TaxID=134534 RepID=UPI0021D31B2F|nr:hypothetical protein [Acinetobacter gyllenbergii]MCU4582175.1 hypothetical protein [Acinetobacter gyllenbergii]